ncbi:uncharacterized protein LOC109616473 [Esox lucius]|uniref:uncharacterized protein LOC109616473 n=1 Tax=Esox lucius TaxID=8010 RepID=UPI000973309C|nr:uncharacterized protein LOC109616473 [Esox lucius]
MSEGQMDADVRTSDYDGDSSASTIILEQLPNRASTPVQHQNSSDEANDLSDSQKTQVRHYKTLQEMYKSTKPHKAAITHMLDLEFESRRRFIISDVLKEQDRPTKVLEAYPCFREVDHVLDELWRIIQPTNLRYISEVKDRWDSFYKKVQFYGVMKKAMKPPKTLNGENKAPMAGLPILVISGKCQSSWTLLGCEHRSHQRTSDPHASLIESVSDSLLSSYSGLSPGISSMLLRLYWVTQQIL